MTRGAARERAATLNGSVMTRAELFEAPVRGGGCRTEPPPLPPPDDRNQLAPGALGTQPAAHFPPAPCSVGYPGRSREWLRPCLFGALPPAAGLMAVLSAVGHAVLAHLVRHNPLPKGGAMDRLLRSTHERHGRKKFWHWWRDSRVDPPPSGAKMATFPGLADPSFHPRREVIPYPDRPGLFSRIGTGGRVSPLAKAL